MTIIDNIKKALNLVSEPIKIIPPLIKEKLSRKERFKDITKGYDGKIDRIKDIKLEEGYDHTNVNHINHMNESLVYITGNEELGDGHIARRVHKLLDAPDVDITLEHRHELMKKYRPFITGKELGSKIHDNGDKLYETIVNETHETEKKIHQEPEYHPHNFGYTRVWNAHIKHDGDL